METNLLKIRNLAAIRENENIRFRTFLKDKDDEIVDKLTHKLHQKYSAAIDCTTCANCCTCLKPELSDEDLQRLSNLEDTATRQYKADYCEDADDGVFFKTTPCRYLHGKRCSIYENRPQECKTFPNTDKDGVVFRLWAMIENYAVCPIVYNLMEDLKDEMRFCR